MTDSSRVSYFCLRWLVLAGLLVAACEAFAQKAISDTIRLSEATVVVERVPAAVIARYPRGVTFLRPGQPDSVLRRVDTELVPVIFKRDKTDLILPNEQLDTLAGLIERILADGDVRLSHVWIGGSASPEGPEEHNVWLGKIRAKRLYDYIRTHTSLPDSLIHVDNLMEDWHTPLRLIRQREFPHKERVLEIWDRQPDSRKRKREIMAIDNGVTWKYLIDKAFRPARNARIAIVCVAGDSIVKYPSLARLVQIAMDLPPIAAPAPIAPTVPVYRSQFVAVKTNLAALGLLVANLGVEFSFGRGFSLDFPVYYSPYDITPDFRVRVLGIQPELRYWLRRDCPGGGHFFGLYGTVAGFNVSFPSTDRYQDPEYALWGVGISYGYAFNFGRQKHWGLEFDIGAGYMNYRFDTFKNVSNGQLLRSGADDYWGISRVGISLTYRFWRRKQIGYKAFGKEGGL